VKGAASVVARKHWRWGLDDDHLLDRLRPRSPRLARSMDRLSLTMRVLDLDGREVHSVVKGDVK
jgi:hypothetical protein